MQTRTQPSVLFIVRNVVGIALIVLAAGAAIALLTVVLGLVLRAGLEVVAWIGRLFTG